MRLTIYKKMMLGFCTIIFIMIMASLYVLMALDRVSDAAKNTLMTNVRIVNYAKQLKVILYDESAIAQKYLVTRDENYLKMFVSEGQNFEKHLSFVEALINDPSISQKIRNTHESFFENFKNYFTDTKTSMSDIEDIRWKFINELESFFDELIRTNETSIAGSISRMEATTTHSAKIALLLILLTLLAAISIAFVITRTITRPITELILGTRQISKGEYCAVPVSSNDEIALLASAINHMSDEINKANEYRTHMIQQISHEINTPLQAMLSAHDLLKDQGLGSLNKTQLELLDDVFRGINRLTDYSRQYLDLVKIESGMMEYQQSPTDLVTIINPLIKDAQLIGKGKHVTVAFDFQDVPPVMGDADKISVIMSNLLSNAVKYAQSGGHVHVKLGHCDLGVRISVQDSGLGICPKDLEKVFTKFYQSGNASQISVSGTGVGLALVKAYTEGHGGRVSVKSFPEKGTIFSVELPVVAGDDAALS